MPMNEHYNSYAYTTDDVVAETGEYICDSGHKRKLYEGDKFPSCPDTEVITFWRHVEGHFHETGEEVKESGRYVDEDGDEKTLEAGETFPNCPKFGSPTKWTHLGEK